MVRRRIAPLCPALFALVFAVSIAAGAPGDLDTGFNGTGKRVIDLGGSDSANAMVIQPDGKIVLAGTGPATTFTLTRLNPDGSLDQSFGGSGTGSMRFDMGHPATPNALAIAPDGKLVVAGMIRSSDTNDDAAVARVNPDGTPDLTFGPVGWRSADFGGARDEATGVAPLPDGKIILAGKGGPGRRFMVARLTSRGIYDGTFAGGGLTSVAGGADGDAHALAVQPDGKIVVAGTVYPPGGSGSDMGVGRLNADGTPDNSFDGDGQRQIELGGNDEAAAVAVLPDGEILVAGSINGKVFQATKLRSNGSTDTAFNGDGSSRIAFTAGVTGVRAIGLQPDGKIVLAGGAESGFAVARVQPGGALDTTFAGDGRQTIVFDGNNADGVNGVAVLPNGAILLAGVTVGTSRNIALVRLQGDAAAGGPGGPGTPGGPGSGASGTPRCAGKRATIVGTNASDRLKGTRRADVIVGLGGSDKITGLGGNDVICGGAGNDSLSGGSGADKVYGEDGSDSLSGGAGNDNLSGGAGNDKLSGGSGNDKLSGGSGKDKLSGGAGGDKLSGGSGKDSCAGADSKSSC
jgi:uncharacterized delta-60 repeat protein